MGSLLPGQLLASKYRIGKILGEGGMGTVLEATHVALEQRVAIKVLHPAAARDAGVVARFLREARAAARVQSEHIVRVHDVGELDDGSPYMVMDLLDGVDLGEHLHAVGRLSCEQAVDLVLQACEALSLAHAAGIVHRDVKPSNLFLSRRRGAPQLKVLDFGISKLQSATEQSQTGTQDVFGSPLYMSPEQLLSTRDVDPRSDVWSLAVVLFELVAGAAPFRGETLAALHMEILRGPIPSLQAVVPESPSGLSAALARALDRDLKTRTSSMRNFAVELAPYASAGARATLAEWTDDMPLGLSSSATAHAPAAPMARTSASFSVASAPGSPRRWWLWPALAGACVALAVVAANSLRDPRGLPDATLATSAALPALILPPPPSVTASALPAEPPTAVPDAGTPSTSPPDAKSQRVNKPKPKLKPPTLPEDR